MALLHVDISISIEGALRLGKGRQIYQGKKIRIPVENKQTVSSAGKNA